MDGPRLTRRQALRLGAGAAALGALRPSPALAASSPALFELPLEDSAAHAAGALWRTTDGAARPAALRPRGPALGPRRARAGADPRAGRGRPLDALDAAARRARPRRRARAGRHRPRVHRHRRRDPAAPARLGARPAAALRARPAPRARPARPRRTGRGPADPAARRLGRRAGAAAIRPELRDGAGGVRPPHGERRRLRARGVAGDHPRDRALPPRFQRLERHRLQLPRRPLRRDLGGPRGRRRGRRRRRPGAGLQQQLDRHRLPRHVHEPAARRARDGVAREADRLEAVAARRAGAGTGDADLRRRPEQPLPERHAGDLRARLRPPRRRRDRLPRRGAVRAAAGPAGPRPGLLLRGLGHHACARPASAGRGRRRCPA